MGQIDRSNSGPFAPSICYHSDCEFVIRRWHQLYKGFRRSRCINNKTNSCGGRRRVADCLARAEFRRLNEQCCTGYEQIVKSATGRPSCVNRHREGTAFSTLLKVGLRF